MAEIAFQGIEDPEGLEEHSEITEVAAQGAFFAVGPRASRIASHAPPSAKTTDQKAAIVMGSEADGVSLAAADIVPAIRAAAASASSEFELLASVFATSAASDDLFPSGIKQQVGLHPLEVGRELDFGGGLALSARGDRSENGAKGTRPEAGNLEVTTEPSPTCIVSATSGSSASGQSASWQGRQPRGDDGCGGQGPKKVARKKKQKKSFADIVGEDFEIGEACADISSRLVHAASVGRSPICTPARAPPRRRVEEEHASLAPQAVAVPAAAAAAALAPEARITDGRAVRQEVAPNDESWPRGNPHRGHATGH